MSVLGRQCLRVSVLALSTLFISAEDSPTAFAAEQQKVGCKISESTVSVEGDVFEVPGGAKRNSLPSGTRYIVMASIRDTDGEVWMLLNSLGGAHVGWIMEKSVKRHLIVSCPLNAGFAPQPQ